MPSPALSLPLHVDLATCADGDGAECARWDGARERITLLEALADRGRASTSVGDDVLDFVLGTDRYTQAYWEKLPEPARAEFVRRLHTIDELVPLVGTALTDRHTAALTLARRHVFAIPERELDVRCLANDWQRFLNDWTAKQELFSQGLNALSHCNFGPLRAQILRIYGGVKTQQSLESKLTMRRRPDALHPAPFALKDCVRYRIVTCDVKSSCTVAIALSRVFRDRVKYSRNLWLHPKRSPEVNPYRAIHMAIAFEPGRIAEVQIMTAAREIGCVLDHSTCFKAAHGMPPHHANWIRNFLLKINITDIDDLTRQQAKTSRALQSCKYCRPS